MASTPAELAVGSSGSRRRNPRERFPEVRVGLVCPYDLGTPGGVQQQVLDIARMLASHGDAVTIVGPGAKAGSDDRFRAVSVGRIRPIRANGSIVPLATGHDIAGRIREVA